MANVTFCCSISCHGPKPPFRFIFTLIFFLSFSVPPTSHSSPRLPAEIYIVWCTEMFGSSPTPFSTAGSFWVLASRQQRSVGIPAHLLPPRSPEKVFRSGLCFEFPQQIWSERLGQGLLKKRTSLTHFHQLFLSMLGLVHFLRHKFKHFMAFSFVLATSL